MTPTNARAVLDALTESFDLVEHAYATDWRHGLPTRVKQLAAKREEVELHKQAIAIAQAEVAALPVGMVEPIAQFIASQEPLGAEFSKVLHDNLDSLYETKEPTK